MSDVVQLAAEASRSYGKNTYIPKPFEHIYTCNTGDLIPAFSTLKINPGSTWKIETSILARLQTSRFPTMARGWIEYRWYYTPHSQVWEHWDEFMGENKESAWISQTTYVVPKISIPSGVTIQNGHLLDHFGWPTGEGNFKASALKLRHYLWVCDQFERDQNIEAPIAPLTGDLDIVYTGAGAGYAVGGKPYQINRKADLFSTALPEPLKGPDTLIPLGTEALVKGTGMTLGLTDGTNTAGLTTNSAADGSYNIGAYDVTVGSTFSGNKLIASRAIGVTTDGTKSGLVADLTTGTAGANIYKVREAARITQIFERDARSGTRAPEMLWARWGVEVDPLEMGRPRLLCANRFPIDFEQVPQTSETTNDSNQGTLTAFGYTNNRNEDGTFSFKYAGCLQCLVAIRFEHKYQYGIPDDDIKFERWDFWHPEFAGTGDQPIYDCQIWATGGTSGTIETKTIFGYGTRGYEYKNFMSLITGQVRSNYAQSLDYVHAADKYVSQPTLSAAWMKENPDNIDRTIFVTSAVADQWLVDFVALFEITDTLPLYDIPGIDRI